MQDIGKSFTYVFEDENWIVKVLLGGLFVLLSFMLIGIPFLVGYAVEVVQNVLAGRPKPLPEWDNLGDKFVKGLLLSLALLIWLIPALAISGFGSLIQGMAGSQDVGFSLVGVLFSCVAFIYEIAFAIIMPAIYIEYALRPEFASAFKINEFISMVTNNLGNFVVVFILVVVVQIIALFGLFALCIGVIFTAFWSYLVMAHLYGQLGRAVGKGSPAAA